MELFDGFSRLNYCVTVKFLTVYSVNIWHCLKLEKDYLGWSCDINLNFPTAPCSRCCPAACEKRWTIILGATCNWTSGYWLIWWVIGMCKVTSGHLNDRYRYNRWWTGFPTDRTHIFDTCIEISWLVFGSNGIWFLNSFSRFFCLQIIESLKCF